MERIIKASTNEGDLVADFFAVPAQLWRWRKNWAEKWIGSDLGRFSIHTTRKRMIGVQRELKKAGKDFRAFEILNLGKYERGYYVDENNDLREEEKRKIKTKKDNEFVKLILQAYKAEAVTSAPDFKERSETALLLSVRLICQLLLARLNIRFSGAKRADSRKWIFWDLILKWALIFLNGKKHGLDIQFKVIPREVFDKKAVEKGQVKFYDVAYIDVKANNSRTRQRQRSSD